jgi:hypothetical protein
MTTDPEVAGSLLCVALSVATLVLALFVLVVCLWEVVVKVQTMFRRLRRWRRRRARRPVFPKAWVLREGIQVKLRVDPDASPLRHEATGLAEQWPQQQADVDAWVSAGPRDVPAD